MTYPRYAEYKDSGVEWLGEVPGHWEVRRLGYLFDERREKVSDKDFEPLSVSKSGVVPQLETAAKTDDNDNRKKVCRGDFVINSRSDRKGSAGLSDRDGSVSLINTVLAPHDEIQGIFAHHLLRSAVFQEEFYRWGKGIVADLWSTNYTEMRSILLAVPPAWEQSAIAVFLDRETAKIDALVAEQEKLIALLAEKRQAVISHAVTKGPNPAAPMKDSGIEWLGEVPEHWKVMPLRRVLITIEQGWSPPSEDRIPNEGEWGVLKTSAVKNGNFHQDEVKALSSTSPPDSRYAVRDGDLLMIRGSGSPTLVGGVAYIKQAQSLRMLPDLLYRLDYSENKATGPYLAYLLQSPPLRHQIEVAARGIDILKIAQPSIAELLVTVPPRAEQTAIVAFLDAETPRLDALTAEARRAIDLLKERRSALISAAVTGKIDVRGLVKAEAA